MRNLRDGTQEAHAGAGRRGDLRVDLRPRLGVELVEVWFGHVDC
jgi:hypothetical protein